VESDRRNGIGVPGPGQIPTVTSAQGLYHLTNPLIAMGVMGILILLLRWAFGHGSSLVERTPMVGKASEYGLLESVASPSNWADGEALQHQLAQHGIRATLVQTTQGLHILVWPDDAPRARQLFKRPG
jgi:hypothetical protein